MNDNSIKYKSMKKIFYFALLVFMSWACSKYDSYIYDYDYSTVYFPHSTLERTFVYGEFDAIKIAVQMGGRRENTVDEWVGYIIDPSLLDSTQTLLPSSHYTLSDPSRFVIESGELGGELVLTVNADFYAEADDKVFSLPLRIIDASVDSVLEEQTSMVLSFKVEAAMFGNYYHNGVIIKSLAGVEQERITYHQEEPVTNDINNWELTTIAKDTLVSNGLGNVKSAGTIYGIYMLVDSNNNVEIFSNTDSGIAATSNGLSSYNPDKLEFYLNYRYQDTNGFDCEVTDTLIFRNRMLDGVNQWNL